ncbi:winged helix-turn-helix domain-containing protein [Candidatus Enterococcus murrayae]|uniref:Winged helix-turn-helix domain-containing protein n=1 Tax=Candidatus Enterococcus murrayae TaxID=2815321 RepID=A0ABS3HMR2_9ENTE|nr:winged helix-turn-helix domain-containing protein [Enterococcus sp. MJM16]MBO0454751.1 winged helix-turn-helix domain-containing protein [Enterococcus sp. MJM16]
MSQVLILTRNILSDGDLQEKLQYLNYEVLCSSSLLDYLIQNQAYPDLMNHFQFIIFSETVSNTEINFLLPLFEAKKNLLFRKVGEATESEELVTIKEVTTINLGMDSLREKLMDSALLHSDHTSFRRAGIDSSFGAKIKIPDQMYQLNLSKLEEKVFNVLYHSNGKVITREDLCNKVWGTGVTNSHLSHLSSIVKKLRKKIEMVNLSEEAIKTIWGEGYQLSSEFFA